MAIAISGSGSISGISVGGLNDGIVDSGTLATNSVDSAELIDGSIDSSHFAAGVVGPTSGTAQATTSAGSKTFSSIPSGTTNIIISFNEVSAATGYSIDVQLGDAGGVESSGYVSSGYTLTASATTAGNSTSGFMVRLGDAAYILSGQMVLTLLDASANTWISSHFGKTDTTAIVGGGGSKSLSAELTQLYILLGSGSYDAGSINIMYW